VGVGRLSVAFRSLGVALILTSACTAPSPSPSPPPATAARPLRSPTTTIGPTTAPTLPPSATPSMSAPATIDPLSSSPSNPYLSAPFAPSIEVMGGPIEKAVIRRVLAAVADAITTVNGEPYVDPSANFSCDVGPQCEVDILGHLASAEGVDRWIFAFTPNSPGLDVLVGSSWEAVPDTVVPALEQIALADREAGYLLSQGGWEAPTGSWFPNQPGTLAVSYSKPAGAMMEAATADAATRVLQIEIDLADRAVVFISIQTVNV
jgi:hypothetical protein